MLVAGNPICFADPSVFSGDSVSIRNKVQVTQGARICLDVTCLHVSFSSEEAELFKQYCSRRDLGELRESDRLVLLQAHFECDPSKCEIL